MMLCVNTLSATRELDIPLALNPFSHFVVIHTILRRLFVDCWEAKLSVSPGQPLEMVDGHVVRSQWALHNWLLSWRHSPETPQLVGSDMEPPFINHGKFSSKQI
jgi:hypothetical protein